MRSTTLGFEIDGFWRVILPFASDSLTAIESGFERKNTILPGNRPQWLKGRDIDCVSHYRLVALILTRVRAQAALLRYTDVAMQCDNLEMPDHGL